MSKIISLLKNDGFRITQERKTIISLFEKSKKPLSIEDLTQKLKNNNILINQSTLYRTIELLIQKKIIVRVDCAKEPKYEIINRNKKSIHNLICLTCGKNKKIKSQNHLPDLILKSYGICSSCK